METMPTAIAISRLRSDALSGGATAGGRISVRKDSWGWIPGTVAILATLMGCSATGVATPITSSNRPPTASPSPPTASPSPTSAANVTSTLDGVSVLPHRIHWQAKPSVPAADVTQVDFLIDSQLAWTEKAIPYFYGDDGNWLVTSFLKPGQHEFQTRLITVDGQTVTDTVDSIVGKPTPPPTLVSGRWARVVSSADVSKATSGQPPPAGRWSLTINEVGWNLTDPQGGGGKNDVAYLAAGRLALRPTIEVPPFPNNGNGAFCHEPDPERAWSYVMSNNDKTMTLAPAGTDPCGDRAAVYQGTWTRTSRTS